MFEAGIREGDWTRSSYSHRASLASRRSLRPASTFWMRDSHRTAGNGSEEGTELLRFDDPIERYPVMGAWIVREGIFNSILRKQFKLPA